ncbi:hypothetical protein Hanom_Chr12g01095471 [Helianthus anomalus]
MDEVEDLEEGEINMNEDQIPAPTNVDSPADNVLEVPGLQEKSLVNQGTSVNQESLGINDDAGITNLHGEAERQTHVFKDIGDGDAQKEHGHDRNGPIDLNSGEKLCRPNISVEKDGPTPIINLGKRNRNDISPPSLGSI